MAVFHLWQEVTHCYEQIWVQWWQEVVVRSWLDVTHCYEQMWVQWWHMMKCQKVIFRLKPFKYFRWETRRCHSNFRVLSKHGFVEGCVDASIISAVLLLLNKFESHCPVLVVVVTHPSHQNVFDVTVCSFNRTLALGMSGFAMNHDELLPQLFELCDDLGYEF